MRIPATIAIFAFVLAAGPARATSIRGPADVEALTAGADAIVHGRVVSRRSHWGDGGEKSGVIFTTVVIAAGEWWKAGPGESAAAQLAVRVPGGVAGGLAQNVEGVAAFVEGEEVVLFLRRLVAARAGSPGAYDVERWALGKFAVATAASAGARVQRDRSGLLCVGCGSDEADELSLEELRGRVVRALAAARAGATGAKGKGR